MERQFGPYLRAMKVHKVGRRAGYHARCVASHMFVRVFLALLYAQQLMRRLSLPAMLLSAMHAAAQSLANMVDSYGGGGVRIGLWPLGDAEADILDNDAAGASVGCHDAVLRRYSDTMEGREGWCMTIRRRIWYNTARNLFHQTSDGCSRRIFRHERI